MLRFVSTWVALPDAARHVEPTFTHHAPTPEADIGWEARVFLGSLLGVTSPVETFTPLLGAELLLEPATELVLDVDETFEHGVLIDAGAVDVEGERADPHDLVYVPPGRASLTLTTYDEPVRLLVLGGPPFGESIVMWWNFVGRSHEEIVEFRSQWQDQITRDGTTVGDSQEVADGRFGVVLGDHLPPIPAPDLPHVRLKHRR